jgi:hypothetical protein
MSRPPTTASQTCQRVLGGGALLLYICALFGYSYAVLWNPLGDAFPNGVLLLHLVAQPCGLVAAALVVLISSKWDPGRVKNLNSRGPHASACKVCDELRPPGSHHCRTCDVCVVDFDHHCAFLGICIARGNRRSFIALLAAGATASALVLWSTAVCATWEMRRTPSEEEIPYRLGSLEDAMPSSAAMATRRRVLIKYVPALLLLVCATWFLLRMAASHVLLYSLGLTSRQKNQACDSAVRSLLLGFVHCATAVAGLIPHALGDACGSWLRKAHMVGDGRHTAERVGAQPAFGGALSDGSPDLGGGHPPSEADAAGQEGSHSVLRQAFETLYRESPRLRFGMLCLLATLMVWCSWWLLLMPWPVGLDATVAGLAEDSDPPFGALMRLRHHSEALPRPRATTWAILTMVIVVVSAIICIVVTFELTLRRESLRAKPVRLVKPVVVRHWCSHCSHHFTWRDHHCGLLSDCVGTHNRRLFLVLCVFAAIGSLPSTVLSLHLLIDRALPRALHSLYTTPPPLLSEWSELRRWWSQVGPPLRAMLLLGPVAVVASHVWLLAFLSFVQQVLYAIWRAHWEATAMRSTSAESGIGGGTKWEVELSLKLRRLFVWAGGEAWEPVKPDQELHAMTHGEELHAGAQSDSEMSLNEHTALLAEVEQPASQGHGV